MPVFDAFDGTELAYHVDGAGEPLICLPGGPMRASAYLGDLGGLVPAPAADPARPARHRRLGDPGRPVELPMRPAGRRRPGPAGSSRPGERGRARALGRGQHRRAVRAATSAPGGQSRAGHAERAVGRPGTRRRDAARRSSSLRQGEPWFTDAAAAFERIAAGGGAEEDWAADRPVLLRPLGRRRPGARRGRRGADERGGGRRLRRRRGVRPGRRPRGPGRSKDARARHRRQPRPAAAAGGDHRVRRAVRRTLGSSSSPAPATSPGSTTPASSSPPSPSS